MSAAVEPTPAALANPLLRYFAATRPPFLSVTLVGCLVGLASAHAGGVRIDALTAILTVLFALMAHAGVNVLNDYFDDRNGTDAANSERVFPFTGGSRFIQNGVLTRRATGVFGYLLLLAVIPAGLWLAAHSAAGLIWIGIAGLVVGWSYSAPPLELVSRGLGEVAITCGWLLVVVGADYVQRHDFSFAPCAAGLAFALLVANVLYINQFPDAKADAIAGKRTVVVRLGAARARAGYGLLAALAGLWLIGCVLTGHLPSLALAALVPLGLSAAALKILWKRAMSSSALAPAIKLTILAAVTHGLVLCLALLFG
ncbi:MAG: prenyltransferase [Proteobacteria bacterium]|nr:prenyltransferase [Pseudomonadota bacterium]